MKKYIKAVMEVTEIQNDAIQTFCLDSTPGCDGVFVGCTESITSCTIVNPM